MWQHEGQIFRDDLVRVFVDALDQPESLEYFRGFKERAKSRFNQIDIWMTTYPIEVLSGVGDNRSRYEEVNQHEAQASVIGAADSRREVS